MAANCSKEELADAVAQHFTAQVGESLQSCATHTCLDCALKPAYPTQIGRSCCWRLNRDHCTDCPPMGCQLALHSYAVLQVRACMQPHTIVLAGGKIAMMLLATL